MVCTANQVLMSYASSAVPNIQASKGRTQPCMPCQSFTAAQILKHLEEP